MAGRNPKSGEVIQIPESKTVKFAPSEWLKKAFN
jgi:nucleoid DNA-binding protein